MRKTLNFIYEYQFVPVLMKNIYRLVNSRKVRNANTIAEKVAGYFHTKGVHDRIFDYYYIVEDKEEPIYNVVQNIIMSVEEITSRRKSMMLGFIMIRRKEIITQHGERNL